MDLAVERGSCRTMGELRGAARPPWVNAYIAPKGDELSQRRSTSSLPPVRPAALAAPAARANGGAVSVGAGVANPSRGLLVLVRPRRRRRRVKRACAAPGEAANLNLDGDRRHQPATFMVMAGRRRAGGRPAHHRRLPPLTNPSVEIHTVGRGRAAGHRLGRRMRACCNVGPQGAGAARPRTRGPTGWAAKTRPSPYAQLVLGRLPPRAPWPAAPSRSDGRAGAPRRSRPSSPGRSASRVEGRRGPA